MSKARLLFVLAIALALAALPSAINEALAADLVVNSLADTDDGSCNSSPDCTLREALNAANANGALPDTITFSVSGTVGPTSALPDLSAGGTTIAGSDQTVTINGSGLPAETDCLTISSGGNAVKGLVITQCPRRGIGVTGANNTIGGTVHAERNVISGNGEEAVALLESEATGNVIIGNYIGTDVTGAFAVANGRIGVEIAWGASDNTVGGPTPGELNVIGGMQLAGVAITGETSTGNVVEGNLLGVNAYGIGAVSNGLAGLAIMDGASSNTVRDNLISGNNGWGVFVGSQDYTLAGAPPGEEWTPSQPLDPIWIDGSELEIRYLGVTQGLYKSPTGWNGPIWRGANEGDDLEIIARSKGLCAEIGPVYLVHLGTGESAQLTAGADNGCGGPGQFWRWFGFVSIPVAPYGPASGNVVQGNYIGTDPTGDPFPNGADGFRIWGSSSSTIIGGVSPGEGNVIAYNDGHGVFAGADPGTTIRGNSIYSNKGKAIENLGAQPDPPEIVALGPVSGNACADCTIDVYSDKAGEGRTYHGWTVANGLGEWTYSGQVDGPAVTATATDGDGKTSEFSAPFKDSGDTDGDTVPNDADPDDDGDGCGDNRELGPNPAQGGMRNPHCPWDYFNPTGDGENRIDDVLAVINHYRVDEGEEGYDARYDRTYVGPNPWNTGPPDGKIRIDDVLNIIAQYRHDCA